MTYQLRRASFQPLVMVIFLLATPLRNDTLTFNHLTENAQRQNNGELNNFPLALATNREPKPTE